MTGKTILIIEDDRNIRQANQAALELSGYHVLTAETLASGRRQIEEHCPDLILLDILLPDGNGLELCRELRAGSNVRILFLSALSTKKDVIEGLRAGGDDYLPKPYLTEELLLRVEALLRRGDVAAAVLFEKTGPLEWHPLSKQVFAGSKDLLLTPREYAVLEMLCRAKGEYLSAEQIYRRVWNAEPNDDLGSVHNHIYCLRNKLKDCGVQIDSLRGKGYRIEW